MWQVDPSGRYTRLHSTISKPKAASQQPGVTGNDVPEIIGNLIGGLLAVPVRFVPGRKQTFGRNTPDELATARSSAT